MPLAIAFRIEPHDRLPSTQSALRERLEAGEDVDGLVLRALRQERGSGRRGRPWASDAGGSYQTLAVRLDPDGALRAGLAAVAAAVGIAEVLTEYGARVQVKWPNDLLYRGRKLGGVLCEVARGHLLVGVGVNVANPPPEGATALVGWDLEGVHGAVLAGVQRGLDAVVDGAPLAARFAAVDALAGRRVAVEEGGRRVEGRAQGIDASGCLLLADGGEAVPCCGGTVVAIDGRAREGI